MPAARSTGTHAASEPRCGHDAPPMARMVGEPSNPSHRDRVTSFTPNPSSRLSQARNSGEAFIALGKMRPDEPTNVSMPSP